MMANGENGLDSAFFISIILGSAQSDLYWSHLHPDYR
jgi:hypothetical protein